MGTGIARRDLLRGRFRSREAVIRPPYAVSERAFLDKCTRCPDCASACEAGLIRLDRDGYPKMLFSDECTFCGDCLDACKTAALSADAARPWQVRARIGTACLAVNGIVCRSCGDNCGPRAIKFRLMTEGRSLPVIDSVLCTGCGACVAVCPNRSMSMIIDESSSEGERPWAS